MIEKINRIITGIEYHNIPVIMLKTVSRKGKIIEAIRAGVKQYIS